MLHFIPAWYQQDNWWENEQKWYVRRMHTEFDDTVKQIQLFQRNGSFPYQILLLGFSPNFRHFLHRQSVFRAPYWSCFDAIQEIQRRKAAVLSFHNMKWPPHMEFIYTPFAVVALREGERFAQIEFSEDGNPIQIDMYEKGELCRRNLYDDRGFVSSTILYRGGRAVRQDFLMESGAWKLRLFPEDGHVEVNPRYPRFQLSYQDYERAGVFRQLSYDSLEQVIREVLLAYLGMTEEEDLFCVAMHGQHTRLLKEALAQKKTILSFFGDRCLPDRQPEAREMIEKADYIITDSRENSRRIKGCAGAVAGNITDISPYDTRVDFGISQQLDVQKILVPVDGMEEGRLLEQARRALSAAGLPEGWAAEEENGQTFAENDLGEAQPLTVLFQVEQCVDELSVSRCMREQRVLVDMRAVPELYLQIAALSMGIPQIVGSRTQFVKQGRNGIILQDMGKLPAALRFYLDNLVNWNDAKVCSYVLGKRYTTDVLMEKWREVIKAIG